MSKASDKSKRSSAWRFVFNVIQIALVLIFMGLFFVGGAGAGYVASLVKDQDVPSYDEMHQSIYTNYLTGFAYFNDGSQIGELRASEGDRRLVTIDQVSPHLINAFIATEDRHFYDHFGIVPKSLMRAAFQLAATSEIQSGGSTLTQQLVKNTLLLDMWKEEWDQEGIREKIRRKAIEIFLAVRVDRMFKKNQILEAYMNEIYFGKDVNGSNIYGVQAAAKGIFGKNADELNLAEAAYLAGIPQDPGDYSPFTQEGLAAGKERQKTVLDRMLTNGYITQSQYEEALAYDIQANLAQPTPQAYSEYPFLMMEIERRAAIVLAREELNQNGMKREDLTAEEYNNLVAEKHKEILRNGYHIYTTVNKEIHELMKEIAENPENFGPNATYEYTAPNGETQTVEDALEEVGATLIDNESGAILAMMGGRDFEKEQTNHTIVPRQPGSAMKPIAAFAPAIEEGKLQPASMIDDTPVILKDGVKGQHVPVNWDYKYHGLMNAREALKRSYNIPAIKVYTDLVGIPTALDYVKQMGITTLDERDYHAQTAVIGGLTYGLTVEEITNAYTTFANEGTFQDAYLIKEIKTDDDETVYRHKQEPKQVFSEETAYLITDMLKSVVGSGGTGWEVRKYVGWQRDNIAGKTGTTNYYRDSWFVGYTPELTLGIWVGYDIPHTLPNDSKRRPIFIWGMVMKELMETYPEMLPADSAFERPENIVNVQVCNPSGLLPTEECKKAGSVVTEVFARSQVPTKEDDVFVKERVVKVDDSYYLAKENTPDDMLVDREIFAKREPIQIPKNTNKPKSYYLPTDWEMTLPEEEDPRTDNGRTPSTPQGLTHHINEGNVVLSWQANAEEDVAGYRIYRAVNGNDQFQKIGAVRQYEEKTFTDANAPSGDIYGYYITAVDVAGKESEATPILVVNRAGSDVGNPWDRSPFPDIDFPGLGNDRDEDDDIYELPDDVRIDTPPRAPRGLKVEDMGSSVKLSWNANPARDDVEEYHVYFSDGGSNQFERIHSTDDTSFQHTNMSEGWYFITAVNEHGESQASNPVKFERERDAQEDNQTEEMSEEEQQQVEEEEIE